MVAPKSSVIGPASIRSALNGRGPTGRWVSGNASRARPGPGLPDRARPGLTEARGAKVPIAAPAIRLLRLPRFWVLDDLPHSLEMLFQISDLQAEDASARIKVVCQPQCNSAR
jgi:hypothetical protein